MIHCWIMPKQQQKKEQADRSLPQLGIHFRNCINHVICQHTSFLASNIHYFMEYSRNKQLCFLKLLIEKVIDNTNGCIFESDCKYYNFRFCSLTRVYYKVCFKVLWQYKTEAWCKRVVSMCQLVLFTCSVVFVF